MDRPIKLKYLDTELESPRSQRIREELISKVIGQNDAIDDTLEVLEKFHSGVVPKDRPIGSLLFLGPTGTGKTSLVDHLGEALFKKDNAVIKIDCGEFQHSHEIAKLIGSPPGYLGHRETPPRLTQETLIKNHTEEYPISIVLFDEIEKASDALWHILLGVLDKAVLTTGDNHVTTFNKSLIFMTSNCGSVEMDFETGGGIGFKQLEFNIDDERMSKIAVDSAKRKFTPEFINRLDKIVPFKNIKKEDTIKIIEVELEKLQKFIFGNISPVIIFEVSNRAKENLAKEGFDTKYNGRNVRKTIEKDISSPMSRILASKQVKAGDKLFIDYKDGKGYTFGVLED